MLILDPLRYSVRDCNEVFGKLLGYQKGGLHGAPIANICPPWCLRLMYRYEKGEKKERRDGENRQILFHPRP